MNKTSQERYEIRKGAIFSAVRKLTDYVDLLLKLQNTYTSTEIALEQFRIIESLLEINYYSTPNKNNNILALIRFVNTATNYANGKHYWQGNSLVTLKEDLVSITTDIEEWVNLNEYPNNPKF